MDQACVVSLVRPSASGFEQADAAQDECARDLLARFCFCDDEIAKPEIVAVKKDVELKSDALPAQYQNARRHREASGLIE